MVLVSTQLWLLSLCLIDLATAASIVHVNGLSIFTQLAPCAQDAVSRNIFAQTYKACGGAATELQSCVCTKNNNLAAVSTSIVNSVSYNCGKTASEDQTSAAAVLSQYCNPDATVTFATPTTNIVTQFITNIAELSYLAPCAQSAVSVAFWSMSELCPEPASLMAPCVCSKNDNSARVSLSILDRVKYYCSNTADGTSGIAFYDAYCAMNKGTTAFPKPTPPPGDMTYYMTALAQYNSLVPCAQSGVESAIERFSNTLCPEGPQALASCICLKEGISDQMASALTSRVKYYCSSTASEDVTSALGVLDFYCDAAKNEVIATVAESAQGGAGAGNTGSRATGTGSDAGGRYPTGFGADNPTGTPNGNGMPNSGPNIAAIVGGVAGGVVVICITGIVAFIILRRKNQAQSPLLSTAGPPEMTGPHELGGGLQPPMPPKSPQTSISQMESTRSDAVSPVTSNDARMPSEMQAHAEGTLQHSPSELQGEKGTHGQSAQEYQQYGENFPPPHEIQGEGYPQPQGQTSLAEAHGQPIHQMPSEPQPAGQAKGQKAAELEGMGWNSGPTPVYSEMDAGQQSR
ncbi:hypothetical protein EsH8_II_001528 [Colletotrichum jinshuiense]